MKNLILMVIIYISVMFSTNILKASFKYNDYSKQEENISEKNINIITIEKKLRSITKLKSNYTVENNEDNGNTKTNFEFVLKKDEIKPVLVNNLENIKYNGYIRFKINDELWLFEKKDTNEKILLMFTNKIKTRLTKINSGTNINIHGKLFGISSKERKELADFYELDISFVALIDEIN